jgi:hypothetical protein
MLQGRFRVATLAQYLSRQRASGRRGETGEMMQQQTNKYTTVQKAHVQKQVRIDGQSKLTAVAIGTKD